MVKKTAGYANRTQNKRKIAKKERKKKLRANKNLVPNSRITGTFAQQIFKSICIAAHDAIALLRAVNHFVLLFVAVPNVVKKKKTSHRFPATNYILRGSLVGWSEHERQLCARSLACARSRTTSALNLLFFRRNVYSAKSIRHQSARCTLHRFTVEVTTTPAARTHAAFNRSDERFVNAN